MTAIASDHGGYALKEQIIEYLTSRGDYFKDLGTYSADSVDYPIYADYVTEAILAGECDRGILICTTGIGISIAANRKKGIRAAVCTDTYMAKMTRLHNDANVLCLGASVIDTETAVSITETFLSTPFSDEEKHKRRIAML